MTCKCGKDSIVHYWWWVDGKWTGISGVDNQTGKLMYECEACYLERAFGRSGHDGPDDRVMPEYTWPA